jgi:hypothetical protein
MYTTNVVVALSIIFLFHIFYGDTVSNFFLIINGPTPQHEIIVQRVYQRNLSICSPMLMSRIVEVY